MSGENCLIFHISQFPWVDLYSNILKMWENREEFWNEVFCMLSPGALVRWCMKPASLDYTLRKKKCNCLTFLRGEFSLLYRYSNFWVLQENHEQFWNRFFAHCYQEHWQNEIHLEWNSLWGRAVAMLAWLGYFMYFHSIWCQAKILHKHPWE